MPLKIVRNDITKMEVDAIVNTANEEATFSSGVDYAVYKEAGESELLALRKKIGKKNQGDVFLTPGFNLPSKYIIHAVSPKNNGSEECEELLRKCYTDSLEVAYDNNCKSIAFPLIGTGNFGFSVEVGLRIAVDCINAFLLKNDMLVYIVVFNEKAKNAGRRLYSDLEEYIDNHYVEEKKTLEYDIYNENIRYRASYDNFVAKSARYEEEALDTSLLDERLEHLSDSFSEYLFYLIELKGLKNSDVYNDAVVTKQTFSKIKLNPDYHPDKRTALSLCIGCKLNIDETRDLLLRAGYALSPSDMTDVIFSYFIEKEIYDMVEIDIVLEEKGLPCFIQ